jgi:hypothetical protein
LNGDAKERAYQPIILENAFESFENEDQCGDAFGEDLFRRARASRAQGMPI